MRTYPIDGAPAETWFSIGPRQSLPGSCRSANGCQEVVADLA